MGDSEAGWYRCTRCSRRAKELSRYKGKWLCDECSEEVRYANPRLIRLAMGWLLVLLGLAWMWSSGLPHYGDESAAARLVRELQNLRGAVMGSAVSLLGGLLVAMSDRFKR